MGIDWFPLWLSLRVAAMSTLVALLAGLWLGWALSAKSFKGKDVLEAAITLPLVLPPTVLGYYLLVLLGRTSVLGKIYEYVVGQPLVFTWQAAVLAALLHSAPLLIKFTAAALESVPRHYGKAGRSLGASEWTLFWRVSLPLAWNQVLAATTLAFARSLGDFGITIMLAGNIPGRTQTLSVAIYDAVEGGRGDVARVLVLVVSAVALVSLTVANKMGRVSPGKVVGR